MTNRPSAPPPPEALASVETFLAWDHRRLDQLFAEARTLAKGGNAAAALTPYDAFAGGLRGHIEAEEEVLFPVFENHHGLRNQGPTPVMRREHEQIRALLDALRPALLGSNVAAFEESAAKLEWLLGMHNGKEENMLYPEIARIADEDGQTDELVQQSRDEMAVWVNDPTGTQPAQ